MFNTKDLTLSGDKLINEPKEILTRGQSISDKVAILGGSWKLETPSTLEVNSTGKRRLTKKISMFYKNV
jgi:hypothetical protein